MRNPRSRSPLGPATRGRRRRARAASALCALVGCTVAFGAAAGASPAATTSASLASIHRMTPTQFTAIERVLVAALPLDSYATSSAPQTEIDAATTKAVNACLKLSTHDPLLRALRAGCPAISAFTKITADIGSCADATCLKKILGRTRTVLRRAVKGSKVSDRAVSATHLAAGCKQALVTPPGGYVAYNMLDAAFAKLQHALTTQSAADLSAAEKAFDAADKRASSFPSDKRSLQLLRAHCR